MARSQPVYICSKCGGASVKWQGQCPVCGEWNCLEVAVRPDPAATRLAAQATAPRLGEVAPSPQERTASGFAEFDRVLGGGLVSGSVVLVGGVPGIGKSTLLLQVAAAVGSACPTLYVSGEESSEQVAMRARRLGVDTSAVRVLAASLVEDVIAAARSIGARCLIIDSIQTMGSELQPSAPGSPNQLRDSATRLIQFAKSTGTAVILIGHVTKEGLIAGPRLLEHMVDAVLYFEDDNSSRYRLLRSVKNRFGAANELGVFAMDSDGLKEVRNPSAIFLSRHEEQVAGSIVTALHQGTRPLLIEVQALTDRGGGGPGRRLAVGLDQGRLALLLAVLHRHAGMRTHEDDVFINVVGGVRVTETAADLAVVAALVSSLDGRPVRRDLVVFAEIGLGGELRPVPYGEERLREAAKLGFRHAVVASANRPRRPLAGVEVIAAARLRDALDAIRERGS
ncbi:MAG: DNA repair protein RadA [Gammaproteobacteria bacterium]|nr:DNA repair protein RadA [Gammaproteobacteria bacterium]